MDEKLLLKAVVLAGEIMLSSGAEVSRVENTMQFMLRRSNCEVTEAVVLATGLFVTMADPGGEPMTFSKRIPARSTNINRICRVNEVSRQFCHMELTVEEAYEELKRIQKEILYKPWMKLAGIIGISVSFIFIYGGNFLDLSTSVLVGICMAAADRFTKILRLNDFSTTAFCGFVVAFSAMLIQELCPFKVSGDVMIMSAIMYLVPGIPFTTAARDTINGDYAAGSARMLECIVVALAVAVGVGFGEERYDDTSDTQRFQRCAGIYHDPGDTEKIYALCVRLGCGGLVGLPDGPEQRPFVYAGSVFIYSGGGLFKSYPGQGQKGPGDSVSDHGNASGSAGSRHIPERLLFPPERLGAGYKKSSGDHPDRRSHCHGDLYHGLSVPAGSGL